MENVNLILKVCGSNVKKNEVFFLASIIIPVSVILN